MSTEKGCTSSVDLETFERARDILLARGIPLAEWCFPAHPEAIVTLVSWDRDLLGMAAEQAAMFERFFHLHKPIDPFDGSVGFELGTDVAERILA